ncbi:hypothetical protein EATG_01073 [Escherichia coli H605]|uniref:Uncharacterized protein n=1 Tax=Escherichia coli H605 TaxID=656410 RepID=A0AAJ3P279_ECOLX|nr:hypothetical protein EATG_01073 [Escherichia coli H605]
MTKFTGNYCAILTQPHQKRAFFAPSLASLTTIDQIT